MRCGLGDPCIVPRALVVVEIEYPDGDDTPDDKAYDAEGCGVPSGLGAQ